MFRTASSISLDEYLIVLKPRRPVREYKNLLFVLEAVEEMGRAFYSNQWSGEERMALDQSVADGFNEIINNNKEAYKNAPAIKGDEAAKSRYEDVVACMINFLGDGKVRAVSKGMKTGSSNEIPKGVWDSAHGPKYIRTGKVHFQDETRQHDPHWVFLMVGQFKHSLAGELRKRGISKVLETGMPGRPNVRQYVLEEFERMQKSGEVPKSLKETALKLSRWLRTQPRLGPMTEKSIENAIRGPYRKFRH